mgnify:CR=1 FL=1
MIFVSLQEAAGDLMEMEMKMQRFRLLYLLYYVCVVLFGVGSWGLLGFMNSGYFFGPFFDFFLFLGIFFCHIHTLLPFEIWPLFQFI